MEKAVLLHPQMGTLKLLKIWDYEDLSLFRDSHFTVAGLEAYWSSFDSAFRHWDTFIFAKKKMKMEKRPGKKKLLYKM